MEQPELDTELSARGAQDLLANARLARLAYLGGDGTPRVIPIGFLWTGGRVVVCTAATAPKVAALGARPEVALTIDAGETPAEARSVTIRGRADVEIVEGVPDEYLAAAGKLMDDEALAGFADACRALYDRMARITVTPHWARYHHFGAGPVPKFLADLADRAAGAHRG
jgi:hypothetical protein